MRKGVVTVLGSSGHLGHAATQGFHDAGWQVTGLGRGNRRPVGGTQFIAGDANDIAVVRAAIAGADVVVYGLHLPYDRWGNGAAEAQLQVVIEAMAGSGKTLLFPGTIYNYRAIDRTVSPTLRQSGEQPRGAVRIRLETMLKQASERGLFQTIILRAGDFYGPGERGEWFEQAMLMHQSRGRLYHLGPLPIRHSWAYLPDLGRAFAALGEQRDALGPFENFHFAGHWVSHRQMADAMLAVIGQPLRLAPLSWWTLAAAGLVNPVMRDIYRMRYLWNNEMELVDPRLDGLLGAGFTTPFETAVRMTVAELADSAAGKVA